MIVSIQKNNKKRAALEDYVLISGKERHRQVQECCAGRKFYKKKVYTKIIDGITVTTSYRYAVYGSVRGLVSEHRLLSAAEKSLKRDQAGCRSQGGYSDCEIYDMAED